MFSQENSTICQYMQLLSNDKDVSLVSFLYAGNRQLLPFNKTNMKLLGGLIIRVNTFAI